MAELECQMEQPGEPGMPVVPDMPPLPGDLEASLPHMLRLSGVADSEHGGANGAGLLDRTIEFSVKRDTRAMPQRGRGAGLLAFSCL